MRKRDYCGRLRVILCFFLQTAWKKASCILKYIQLLYLLYLINYKLFFVINELIRIKYFNFTNCLYRTIC